MNKPKTLIAVSVRFLGATNTKGARVKLTLSRFNESKTIPYDYEKNNAEGVAIAFFLGHGIQPFARYCTSKGSTLLFAFEERLWVQALFA
jgi:hypothetical protein